MEAVSWTYSELNEMDQGTLIGIGGIVSSLATIGMVFLRGRKVNADVHAARDRRNIDLENQLFQRFREELQRVDGQFRELEKENKELAKKYDDCEKQHRIAQEEIAKWKEFKIVRDQQIEELERKINTVQ